MYNVPHKYRQVCRLCLTLVNECDIGDLQIYNCETTSPANETVGISQHQLYVHKCNINENASKSKCVCNALDPNTNTCCCQCDDNSLSAVQSNNPNSQHKNNRNQNNYTPSVPSAIANPPCTTFENNIMYARMFSNQSQNEVTTNPIGQEERQQQLVHNNNNKKQPQHDIVHHDNAKSSSAAAAKHHVFHDIGENTSSNENYNQEHKDDSSPHITIQIFNCLSIKVRQSCF